MPYVGRTGRVSSGFRKATQFLAPRHESLSRYFGADAFPGTLNITLDRPLLLRPEASLRFANEEGVEGFGFWPAEMMGKRCLIHRWPLCPLHVVECVSDIGLRESCGLQTGDRVRIDVADDLVAPLGFRHALAWSVLWLTRRHSYYTDPLYANTVEQLNPAANRLASQPVPVAITPE